MNRPPAIAPLAFSLVVCFASFAVAIGGGGILLALDPFAAPLVIVPIASDPSGAGSLKTGIPADIPIGFAISAQTAWLQPQRASCGGSPLGYVSSRGVTIRIQP